MIRNRYTLPQLLTDYQIEIPVIQRDYAQGRKDPKSSAIRERFVSYLINRIDANTKTHLDFIYGKVRDGLHNEVRSKNNRAIQLLLRSVKDYARTLDVDLNYNIEEKAVESNTDHFIPLDGQQRITTLYLLYWYLAKRTGNLSCLPFGNFSYKTRKSSRDFCAKLNEQASWMLTENQSPTNAIKNQVWFYHQWQHDPTVAGMLTTLDEIHYNLSKKSREELSDYLAKITGDECLITFDFFNLESIDVEDDLYIKMNARGRQLDDFENFKSWLIGSLDVDKKNQIDCDDWDKKMDKEWLDLFWKNRRSIKGVDKAQLNFFIRMAQFSFIQNLSDSVSLSLDKKVTEIVDNLDVDRNDMFISTQYFEKNKIFNTLSLNMIFAFLERVGNSIKWLDNVISKYSAGLFFKNKLKDVFFADTKLSNFPDRVFVFSIVCFVIRKNKNIENYDESDKNIFFSWVRTCQNLIYNTRIDEFPEYIIAVKVIADLSEYAWDVLTFLLKIDDSQIAFFNKAQVKEERIKAQLIASKEIEESELHKYEIHHYLYGQIGFLIKAATVQDLFDKGKFLQFADRITNVFTVDNLDSKDKYLQRAFLCYDDYLIKRTSNRYNFCLSKRGSVRDRDENWRTVFAMPKIMDKLLADKRSLGDVVKEDSGNIQNWTKYLIRYPKALEVCKQGLISCQDVVDGKKHIRLLGASQLNHYHCELFSYCYYLALKNAKYDVHYEHVKSSHEFNWLKFKINDNVVKVRFNPQSYQFEFSSGEDNAFEPVDEAFEVFAPNHNKILKSIFP